MNRADRFDFTLDEESEKRLHELLTDMDTRNTDRFWIKDKRGYHAEYVKVRHGKWVAHLDRFANGAEYFNYGECSECHDIFNEMDTIGNHPIWDYCPSCGARMDKDD